MTTKVKLTKIFFGCVVNMLKRDATFGLAVSQNYQTNKDHALLEVCKDCRISSYETLPLSF